MFQRLVSQRVDEPDRLVIIISGRKVSYDSSVFVVGIYVLSPYICGRVDFYDIFEIVTFLLLNGLKS